MIMNFLQLAIGGLAMGAIYSLIAVGYTMVWQAIGKLNFSQGQAVMLSSFFGLMIVRIMPDANSMLTFFAVIIGSCVLSAFLAYIMHKLVIEPIIRSSHRGIAQYEKMNMIVGTLSVGIIFENIAKIIWTGEPQNFPTLIGKGNIIIGGMSFPLLYLWMIILTGILVVLLQFFFYYTRAGKSMRAVSQDKDAAALMGVDVRKSIQVTFIIVYILGAIAGVMVAPILFAYFANGAMLGMKGFSAAILGGISSIPGSILGGLILGVIESVGASIVGSGYRNALAFGILIVVLLIKPTGLFSKKTISKI